jgi:hypothetical protein
MPKKIKKTTEFVASVTEPNRDTPKKRQKAKKLIKPVQLKESPNQQNFINSLKSPSPNKKNNKRLNEAKK